MSCLFFEFYDDAAEMGRAAFDCRPFDSLVENALVEVFACHRRLSDVVTARANPDLKSNANPILFPRRLVNVSRGETYKNYALCWH